MGLTLLADTKVHSSEHEGFQRASRPVLRRDFVASLHVNHIRREGLALVFLLAAGIPSSDACRSKVRGWHHPDPRATRGGGDRGADPVVGVCSFRALRGGEENQLDRAGVVAAVDRREEHERAPCAGQPQRE